MNLSKKQTKTITRSRRDLHPSSKGTVQKKSKHREFSCHLPRSITITQTYVIWTPARNMRFASSRGRIELKESILKMFINLHDCCLIRTSITIVRRTKNRHHIFLMTPIVAFHDQLMCPRHQCQSISMVKLFRYVVPKRVAGTPRRDTPATTVVRV